MSSYCLPFGARRTWKSIATLFALALCLVGGPASAITYTLVDLATLDEGATVVIRGMDSGGTGVGAARVDGAQRGLLFRRAGLQAVDGLPGSDHTVVFGINDLGVVVGGSNTATSVRAFLRTQTGAVRELTPLAGDTASTAFGVNNHNQSVGMSSGPIGERGVVWTADGAVSVLPGVSAGASRARALNDRGDVVGVADSAAGPRAVVWPRGGAAVQIGALPGRATSEAVAVNARGDIVGYSADTAGARRATLWTSAGTVIDLGALPGGEMSQALAINNAGLIVGTSVSSVGNRACLWMPAGGLQDLNALIAPSSAVLTHATGINQAGAIVAFGHDAVNHTDHDGHDDDHELPVRVFLLLPSGATP